MCKLLEKIINKLLLWTLENENIISPHQNGFRSNRTTIDNIVALENEIHEAIANHKKCIAVFFDIKKAYDTAWKYGVIKKLQDYNIRGHCLACVENFFK